MKELTPWFPKTTRWSVRLEFKARDFWVGAYWDRREGTFDHGLDIWICLLPMLPIHITENGWRGRREVDDGLQSLMQPAVKPWVSCAGCDDLFCFQSYRCKRNMRVGDPGYPLGRATRIDMEAELVEVEFRDPKKRITPYRPHYPEDL